MPLGAVKFPRLPIPLAAPYIKAVHDSAQPFLYDGGRKVLLFALKRMGVQRMGGHVSDVTLYTMY